MTATARLTQCAIAIILGLLGAAIAEDGPTTNDEPPLEHVRQTTAMRSKIGLERVVHLAYRTDGLPGIGTEADPYDASTAEKFDRLMEAFDTLFAKRDLLIVLAPGIFLTKTRDSYGANAGGNYGIQHWLHANWTLQGSGMFATEIRNVNPNTNGVTMFNSTGGTWGGPEEGNVTIIDVTLNPHKSAFCDSTTHEKIAITSDGRFASASLSVPEWTKGTQIRITDATNTAFLGTHVLSSTADKTVSFEYPFRASGVATIQRSGQWTAVRLNGGNLKLTRVRAIDCGSSAPEVECWPLWLGSGDGNTVNECIIEKCSGHMSAVGVFPGTHPAVRNTRVDASGCETCLGISAACGLITGNYVKNATNAIYADTFGNEEGTVITGNILENASAGGIVLRPIRQHRGVIITNNIVTGGTAKIAITIEPLLSRPRDPLKGFVDAQGQKIWVNDVTIANNSVGDKEIRLGQVRGARVTDNTAGSGGFYFMDGEPVFCYGNRTMTGELSKGLRDSSISGTKDAAPIQPYRHRARQR